MKVTLKPNPTPEPKSFPRLMQYSDNELVLLVTKKDNFHFVGVVVAEGNDNLHRVGHHSYNWDKNNLVDFNGSITLEN